MKYYIPTSSLNLDNILQAECISPESFYAQRLFGYRYLEQLDQLRPFRQIILFRSPISFTINDPDRYNYPVLIEFEGTNQDQAFVSVGEGVYLCSHTIQITPSNCRIFFFSESEYNLTVVNTKSNKTIKYFEKYQIYPSCPFPHFCELKIPTNVPSMELGINEEIFTDKAKGALYAWMLGLKSSVNKELAIKINLAQSLYNILTSLGRNPDSYSRLKPNLDSLIEQFKLVDEIEKLNKQTYDANFEKELGRFGFLKSCLILFLKKWDCWDYLNAKLCNRWNCSFLPDTKDLTSGQDFLILRTEIENRTRKSLAAYQSRIDFTNFSKVNISKYSVTISNAPLVSIALKCIIDNKWTCEYLMANRIEAYKVLMGNVVAYLKNNMGEEIWDNSRERTYINELYAFLYDPSRSFNLSFYNKELEAISAFLVKGNSYLEIRSYLKINEIEDYTLPLVLWGALSGYMDMNRDYLEGILSESVYNKVYGMLFGVSCSVLQNDEKKALEDWQNGIRTYAVSVIKRDKQKLLTSLDEALVQNGNNQDYYAFVTILKKFDGWKPTKNGPCAAWKRIQEHFVPSYCDQRIDKPIKKQSSEKTERGLFDGLMDGLQHATQTNKSVLSGDNEAGRLKKDMEQDSSISEGQRDLRPINATSANFVDDINAEKFILSRSYLPNEVREVLAKKIISFQKDYSPNGYYYGREDSPRTNNNTIKHFINKCTFTKGNNPSWIPSTIENKALLERLKQELFDRYANR